MLLAWLGGFGSTGEVSETGGFQLDETSRLAYPGALGKAVDPAGGDALPAYRDSFICPCGESCGPFITIACIPFWTDGFDCARLPRTVTGGRK